MKTPTRFAITTVAVLGSSLVLAACGGVQLQSQGEVPLQLYNQNSPVPNQPTSQQVKKETTQPATAQKGQMKTLNDFKPIEATEVTLTTTKGDIVFTLYREQAPLTTANFLDLASQKFYDGVVFHRVIPDFMAQVGDPLSKDEAQKARWGTGGPGYSIADEFSPDLKHDSEGVVSMANAGPNTGGSQFFITYEATPWLDGKHAVFGKVTKGMDVLRSITIGDKITSVSYR